jgi:hypothetical protein
LIAAAADFMPGGGLHMTNFERLRRVAEQIQNIEINIELGNRNVELEEIVRELEAKVRMFEENVHIAVKKTNAILKRECASLKHSGEDEDKDHSGTPKIARGADEPPAEGLIWFKTNPKIREELCM